MGWSIYNYRIFCQEIAAVPQKMLQRAKQEGRHLTDIIFRM